MFRPRLIAVLLLKAGSLVKSRKFADYRYLGDPLNAVRLFNELGADELLLLDIDATRERRSISVHFVEAVAEEARMPFGIGGGIRDLDSIRSIVACGAEKIILGAIAAERTSFIREAVTEFGSSTIGVCMDVRKGRWRGERAWIKSGTQRTTFDPVTYARRVEEYGAGELIVQSIMRDGTMSGFDLDLLSRVATAVSIPVVALGGAGNLEHAREAYVEAGATAVAAGSMFVFHGEDRGVLINYPDEVQLRTWLCVND